MKNKSTLSLIIFLLFIKTIAAQNITGDIEGRIIDSTGSSLYGVNISLQSENLQGHRGATTNDEGYFRLLSLPIGSYKAKISFVGYREIIFENVQISLGKTTNLGQIQLQQEAYSLPEVTISGEKFSIDPASTTYGGNLKAKDFENLPIERNYQNMISLLPQANLSYYGDQVNIGGATGNENKYFVDGVEVTDPFMGGSSTYLPYNFIKEIEVKAGGYEAEIHSTLGGVVNVVTNSGTNEFHGSAFGFFTNNNFASHKELGLLDPTQGNFSDYDFGFSLGGPIIQDKLWFFAAYNPTFINRNVNVPDFGISVDRTLRHSFAAKLNWSASQQMRFNLILTGDPTRRKAVGRDVLVPPAELRNSDVYMQDIGEGGVNFALNGSYSINSNFLIEGTAARVIRHDTGEPSTERGKEVRFEDNVNNIWSGGVGNGWDSFRAANILKLTGTISSGSHTIIAGAGYQINETENNYNYHSIHRWGDSYYEEYEGRGFQIVSQQMPSAFIQDAWKIFNSLTLSAGVRWEGQYIIGSDSKVAQTVVYPLQPRIGVTFVPDKDGKNKFYGSFGRYSQEFALSASTGYFSDQTIDTTFIYHSDPRIPGTVPDTAIGGFGKINPATDGLRGQYTDEFSLGYERLFGDNIRIGIQGVYKILQEVIDDAFILDEGRFRFGNPGEGLLKDFPRATRDYKAFIFFLEWGNDTRFYFNASYVLSKNYGNFSGLFDAITHNFFPNGNSAIDNPFYSPVNTTGLLPNDRTHLFKFSGSYTFPFGLITGFTFTAQSGTPKNDLSGTPFGIQYLVPRGTAGRTAAVWDLNARFAYYVPLLYRMRLIMDIFHIASQLKAVDIDQFRFAGVDENGNPLYNSNFGKAYRYQQPMSVRLGMEVSF